MAELPGRAEHNVLLKAPLTRGLEFDHCVDMLTPVEPADANIWSLGITLPPDERLRIWEARREEYPADFRIVSAQPMSESASIDQAQEMGVDPGPRFRRLKNPKNLTRLGVELTESLEQWEDNGNQTTACFHSLTSLLQHVSTERAYRFLHSFTNQVRQFDVRAHYHINPRAHDERDIQRLATLFDAVRHPAEE